MREPKYIYIYTGSSTAVGIQPLHCGKESVAVWAQDSYIFWHFSIDLLVAAVGAERSFLATIEVSSGVTLILSVGACAG